MFPRVLAGWVAGLIAVGAVVVWLATYLDLPQRVDAGEVRDEVQDDRFEKYLQQQELDRATALGYQEAVTDLLQQGVANTRRTDDLRPPSKDTWEEEDASGCWTCTAVDYDTCWDDNLWYRCPITTEEK